jgi:signal transduction histidine kinase
VARPSAKVDGRFVFPWLSAGRAGCKHHPAVNTASQLRSIRLFAAAAACAWTAALLVSCVAYARFVRRGVVELAAAQARESFQKDLAYRRWVARQGGVYVRPTDHTPPNPYLPAPDRDAALADGRPLTLVNPAYMTRQVLDDDRQRGGAVSRITSLNPIRPENGPDPWEAQALAALAGGATEVVDELSAGEPVLRYMGRLVAEERCLGCHAAQGVKLGDLRGGISISIPMASYAAVADAQVERIALGHGVAWLLGVGAIAGTGRRAARRARERERERERRAVLEAELSHARRLEALGRLAGGVAHDLNNLLSPILGNAQLALETMGPDHPLHDDLRDIHDAAERARVLTHQLLAFGRKQVLSVEPIDASATVEALAPMLRRLLGAGIELRTELGAGLPATRADRAQLGAALLNLAANGRDAMPSGGVLTVSTACVEVDCERGARVGLAPGPHVAIAVGDTGAGIDEATRVRLFEPFFTTKPSGNGLGLASAHGTVRQLGGAIEVESAPGAGSTFRILLPAVGEQAVTPGPIPLARPERAGGGETVLLVEDEDAVRRTATNVLASLGYRVLAAADGEEALRLVAGRERELGALVSDLQMPRMDGRALHARLAALRPGLPTVFITGFASETLGPATPGVVVVHKPFTPGELGAALRRVLDAADQLPRAASRV